MFQIEKSIKSKLKLVLLCLIYVNAFSQKKPFTSHNYNCKSEEHDYYYQVSVSNTKKYSEDSYTVVVTNSKSLNVVYKSEIELVDNKLYLLNTMSENKAVLFDYNKQVKSSFRKKLFQNHYILIEKDNPLCEPMGDVHFPAICIIELNRKFQIRKFVFYNGYEECNCEKK